MSQETPREFDASWFLSLRTLPGVSGCIHVQYFHRSHDDWKVRKHALILFLLSAAPALCVTLVSCWWLRGVVCNLERRLSHHHHHVTWILLLRSPSYQMPEPFCHFLSFPAPCFSLALLLLAFYLSSTDFPFCWVWAWHTQQTQESLLMCIWQAGERGHEELGIYVWCTCSIMSDLHSLMIQRK